MGPRSVIEATIIVKLTQMARKKINKCGVFFCLLNSSLRIDWYNKNIGMNLNAGRRIVIFLTIQRVKVFFMSNLSAELAKQAATLSNTIAGPLGLIMADCKSGGLSHSHMETPVSESSNECRILGFK